MLAKGRKVSGRGKAVAANYAFGPLEDDVIIKHRLLIRTTTTKGRSPLEDDVITRGEPPLKKLQKLTSLFVELDKNEDNFAYCDTLAKAFLQELNAFENPLLKSKAVIGCESPGEAQLRRAEGGD